MTEYKRVLLDVEKVYIVTRDFGVVYAEIDPSDEQEINFKFAELEFIHQPTKFEIVAILRKPK